MRNIINEEEKQFLKTLSRGKRLFERTVRNLDSSVIPGEALYMCVVCMVCVVCGACGVWDAWCGGVCVCVCVCVCACEGNNGTIVNVRQPFSISAVYGAVYTTKQIATSRANQKRAHKMGSELYYHIDAW